MIFLFCSIDLVALVLQLQVVGLPNYQIARTMWEVVVTSTWTAGRSSIKTAGRVSLGRRRTDTTCKQIFSLFIMERKLTVLLVNWFGAGREDDETDWSIYKNIFLTEEDIHDEVDSAEGEQSEFLTIMRWWSLLGGIQVKNSRAWKLDRMMMYYCPWSTNSTLLLWIIIIVVMNWRKNRLKDLEWSATREKGTRNEMRIIQEILILIVSWIIYSSSASTHLRNRHI